MQIKQFFCSNKIKNNPQLNKYLTNKNEHNSIEKMMYIYIYNRMLKEQLKKNRKISRRYSCIYAFSFIFVAQLKKPINKVLNRLN